MTLEFLHAKCIAAPVWAAGWLLDVRHKEQVPSYMSSETAYGVHLPQASVQKLSMQKPPAQLRSFTHAVTPQATVDGQVQGPVKPIMSA